MFHYFYGESHGAGRIPSASRVFGNVHHHHGNSSTCLCFASALAGPESDEWVRMADFRRTLPPPGGSRLRASLGADIPHPPEPCLI
jgi:hypothetical protein